jgi:hypothetical protein
MSDSEEKEKVVEEMRQKKEEYVENIAQESNMTSEEGREIVRQALDEKIITEELRNVKIEKDGIRPSILEDVRHTLSSKGASRSRAKISSFEVEESDIKITFTVIGTGDKFVKSYDIQQLNTIDEGLEDIFILTDTDANNPNELEGCTVPVKPSNYYGDIEYKIDKPPDQVGLSSRFGYRVMRLLKRLELIRYNVGKFNTDIYTPTGRLYAVVLFLALVSTQLGVLVGTIFIIILIFILLLLILVHTEGKEQSIES